METATAEPISPSRLLRQLGSHTSEREALYSYSSLLTSAYYYTYKHSYIDFIYILFGHKIQNVLTILCWHYD